MMQGNWTLAKKRTRLEQRARIVQTIRSFFVGRDFLEVETPHRIPGNAPEAHIDAVQSDDWFLHTSPELCMKRLLAAGYPQLFQLCRCWRAAERGSRHLPEFTMLEWYAAGCDYHTLMEQCESLLATLLPGGNLTYRGQTIDLTPPWERLTVDEAFDRYGSLSLRQALDEDRFDEIISFEIEPRLGIGKPTFLMEYPAELAALARRHPERPHVAERFELYIAGLELANAFSELTDPVEQRGRFVAEEAMRRDTGKPPYPSPEKFLRELEAMPEAAGIALGVDRLVMLITGAETIDEIVAFTPELL
ncbi:translation elongation factor P-lysine lysyltransferase [Syntrophotalea carbinolica DSM 2380]|uniref:Translation elongation factor P-lysine lysyltransferase n=1 Tax=Syntrophotalea carbinolica (strain DSM 2380 / NBRC 103641 / GraBd1) TaxID=338963 RepID=Q3A1M8_SYNC1|nr:EF-P lysine aminoacylase EpmA [Syntrophotalea carbinolica]ABA89729.1 translation elongation factor P-lysine lysyltransferase [Syntrophotalea carbinolica DSM 2380]